MNQQDLLAFYRNELERSKKWRSNQGDYSYDDAWRRYLDLYQGLHYDQKNNTDQLTVNMIFATINVMAPAVAIHNPKFVLNGRNPQSGPQAIVTEEVLNYLWRTHEYQREFRLSVLDWLIMGHGWLKVGYKATKPPKSKKTRDLDTQTTSPSQVGSEGGDEGIDDRDETVEGNVESEVVFLQDDDRPFVERLSPFDMYCDPDARHPKEMRWIAQRTWRAVQDVNVDARYSPKNRTMVSARNWSRWDSVDGDGRAGNDNRYTTDRPDQGAIGYAEIIEFYDIKRNTVSTWATDHDQSSRSGYLIKPTQMPYALGHPFVMMRNYEIPDHFYPMGDVQHIESLQLELNETRNQMLNYRKKFRRAWLYAKDRFDSDGTEALQSDQDNVMVPVQGDADPSTAVAPMPAAITPPEFFEQSGMIQADIDRVSGVSDYQRGNPQQNIKRTATEAAMIQDAANARAQDRLMKIEQMLAEAGERVVGLMQQYTTGEKVARIVTIPVKGWINYTPEHIAGQFDFDVQAGSTEPRNESFRRQSAMQLVDASMPFLEMGVANPMALYQKILSDGFGEKDVQRFIQPPPPPEPEMPPEEGAVDPQTGEPPPPEGGMPPQGMPPQGGPPPEMMGAQAQPMPMPGPGPAELDPAMFAEMMQAQNATMPFPEQMAGPPMEGEIPPELLALMMEEEGLPPGAPI